MKIEQKHLKHGNYMTLVTVGDKQYQLRRDRSAFEIIPGEYVRRKRSGGVFRQFVGTSRVRRTRREALAYIAVAAV